VSECNNAVVVLSASTYAKQLQYLSEQQQPEHLQAGPVARKEQHKNDNEHLTPSREIISKQQHDQLHPGSTTDDSSMAIIHCVLNLCNFL
jgi:hypothetical protein